MLSTCCHSNTQILQPLKLITVWADNVGSETCAAPLFCNFCCKEGNQRTVLIGDPTKTKAGAQVSLGLMAILVAGQGGAKGGKRFRGKWFVWMTCSSLYC